VRAAGCAGGPLKCHIALIIGIACRASLPHTLYPYARPADPPVARPSVPLLGLYDVDPRDSLDRHRPVPSVVLKRSVCSGQSPRPRARANHEPTAVGCSSALQSKFLNSALVQVIALGSCGSIGFIHSAPLTIAYLACLPT